MNILSLSNPVDVREPVGSRSIRSLDSSCNDQPNSPIHQATTHFKPMQHIISRHKGIRREWIDPSQHIEFDVRQLLELRADRLAIRNRFPAKLSASSLEE